MVGDNAGILTIVCGGYEAYHLVKLEGEDSFKKVCCWRARLRRTWPNILAGKTPLGAGVELSGYAGTKRRLERKRELEPSRRVNSASIGIVSKLASLPEKEKGGGGWRAMRSRRRRFEFRSAKDAPFSDSCFFLERWEL
jgi:hypothetical protein